LIQRHLDWLEPLDRSEQSKATEYSDLYLQVARKFLELGLFQNALTFYQALKRHPSLVTPSLYVEMGKCFHGSGLGFKAEDCFQMAIQIDQVNIDARMGLANMYEQMGEQEQAFIYVNEVMSIKRAQNQTVRLRLRPGPKPGHKRLKLSALQSKPELPAMPTGRRAYKPLRLADPVEKLKEEVARAEQLQSQYYAMRVELQGMRDGNAKSRDAWMEAARDLTDDFRSFKTFYPWDKYVKFLGYTGGTRALAETPLDTDLTEMADRLSRSLFCPLPCVKDVSTNADRFGGRRLRKGPYVKT
jgi:general transcription factor 3C polypeptide 3 (transcription factor C subunit 4)